MKFVPRSHQLEVMHHMFGTDRNALWVPMGGGKTSATLHACLMQDAVYTQWPLLVLGPLRVARSTWPNEVNKWDDLNGLRCSSITGSLKEREAAIAKPAEIYTTNYENIPWLVERLKDSKHPWPFRRIIADEATRLKGYRPRQGGKQARALSLVCHRYTHLMTELTGTPSAQGLEDLWGQIWFLDQGARLGRTFTEFSHNWFRRKPGEQHGLEAMPQAMDEIKRRVVDICISVELPWTEKPVVIPQYVDLPGKAYDVYRSMEREFFAELESGTELEVFAAGPKGMKLRQLADGVVYTDSPMDAELEGRPKGPRTWEVVHDVKMRALESIIYEAAGMPVIIVYSFTPELELLMKAFPKGKLFDSNPQTENDWNAGKIPQLFMHHKSGYGSNLQDGGNIMALYSLDWSLEKYLQAIERIGPARQAQSGHNRPTYIYPIVARNTVDEQILERNETRADLMQVLLDAANRKKQ